MKKILIINGHPNPNSYCKAMCLFYADGAREAGHSVEMLNLHELRFDPVFYGTYNSDISMSLEKDLQEAQKKIKAADHLVVVHPVWWGSVPALLKGFFDRTLLPGFAFKYRKDNPFWDKLLGGKTASILYTSDTPNWVYRYIYGRPSVKMLRDRVLGFCGIKTRLVYGIGPMRNAKPAYLEAKLNEIKMLGRRAS